MERYSKFSLFGRFIPRDLWAALPIQPVVWFLLKGNHNGVQWGLRRGASRFISGGGSSFLNPVPPVHQKYRTTLKNWRGFGFFFGQRWSMWHVQERQRNGSLIPLAFLQPTECGEQICTPFPYICLRSHGLISTDFCGQSLMRLGNYASSCSSRKHRITGELFM